MSPKQQRGEATVDRILDAALRVYAESGEQGLTVSAVTKASGVSMGSLYHHFGSIDGLTLALSHRWLSRLLGDGITALQGADTAKDGVRALVRAYLAFIQEHPHAARLVHSPLSDRQSMVNGHELRASHEAPVSAFGLWIQPRVESGELAPLPLPLIETLILGPVVGLARRWLSGIHDVDLDEAAGILAERIWRSVSAEPR
ncbi:TetR/AcrR family transcriptional regulator [Streptomyces sp. uw30]|uniref:TetR/AcrR family transcriptional regulator n=1 Tax=Streptomyces sp. uw30 TaxID=1828179 RepID=UPI0011CEB834|nr:TetR/AcrR family transcriptional regulator [Streptomyces sp. uw30]TXS34947.1 TetR/AcrR family transcriptional regulator [Streptomyces sp. uw30]